MKGSTDCERVKSVTDAEASAATLHLSRRLVANARLKAVSIGIKLTWRVHGELLYAILVLVQCDRGSNSRRFCCYLCLLFQSKYLNEKKFL
jgi:hypothetical protein